MTAHNKFSRRTARHMRKVADCKERIATLKRNRLSDWEIAHENLLAELLSQDSGDAKDNPQEKADEEAEAQQMG
jgi:hypothetical protein